MANFLLSSLPRVFHFLRGGKGRGGGALFLLMPNTPFPPPAWPSSAAVRDARPWHQ